VNNDQVHNVVYRYDRFYLDRYFLDRFYHDRYYLNPNRDSTKSWEESDIYRRTAKCNNILSKSIF